MDEFDIKCMKEAIDWAADCKPVDTSIPKVGAIIAADGVVITSGRRGTGREGDDDHAEKNAMDRLADKTKLAGATLYTTLEPCTPEVRTRPFECCTELICNHKLRKVFIGMLDPNQGVTGKGVWQLQDRGIEVEFFQHNLVNQIRAMNEPFVTAQQGLGAKIISPLDGATLRTFETAGKATFRFTCLNAPTDRNYLLAYHAGECWPQYGTFREVDNKTWEIDANFGAGGLHTMQIVTANDLGKVLIEYYRKVVGMNQSRRNKLTDKLAVEHRALIGGDYPGIPMIGLPKGLRLETSVDVTIAVKKE